MSKKLKIHQTEYVEATDLIPENWTEWFWSEFSEHCPFSFGDNYMTIVTAEAFADHCQSLDHEGIPEIAYQAFMRKLRRLGQMYIDLEN